MRFIFAHSSWSCLPWDQSRLNVRSGPSSHSIFSSAMARKIDGSDLVLILLIAWYVSEFIPYLTRGIRNYTEYLLGHTFRHLHFTFTCTLESKTLAGRVTNNAPHLASGDVFFDVNTISTTPTNSSALRTLSSQIGRRYSSCASRHSVPYEVIMYQHPSWHK